MHNNWKLPGRPIEDLSKKGIALMKEEYQVLDEINKELYGVEDRALLLEQTRAYVSVIEKWLAEVEGYVVDELAQEIAQCLTIKGANLVRYDYGVMYFDNVTNIPLLDVFLQIEA